MITFIQTGLHLKDSFDYMLHKSMITYPSLSFYTFKNYFSLVDYELKMTRGLSCMKRLDCTDSKYATYAMLLRSRFPSCFVYAYSVFGYRILVTLLELRGFPNT